MTEKKENNVVFSADNGRGIIIAWVQASSVRENPDTPPKEYLTKEGMAYLNGFLQSNNTVALVKKESFDNLTEDYADLVEKYEKAVGRINYLEKINDGYRTELMKLRRKKPSQLFKWLNKLLS